ncbi:MAG TPA: hypothetical protein DCS82_05875 [Rhodospirillaceae bacterium]|nr:hypothetical protein [Rhodospirillaceae bacterium]HAT35223.1 hypothetical protein [Rhodospirillaceae bacterium]|tara:strand:- start:2 stop:475 length:474 start_codon:yes stop_codon:yes gene_type:complete
MAEPKITQPELSIAAKVKRDGRIDTAKQIKSADEIIANVAQEFVAGLEEEFGELDRLSGIFQQTGNQTDLQALFRRIHNLRGLGTTMGFPLVSRIGSSFCRYIVEKDDSTPIRQEVVDQHLAALRIVYQQRIDGAGDEISQQVAAALETVVSQELAR